MRTYWDFLSACICIPIYGSTALCWALASFSVSWSFTESVGLLGWGIIPSQGHYLHTGQHEHRINTHKHLHASSGIQTHDPCVSAGEDSSCLRPYSHYDWHLSYQVHKFQWNESRWLVFPRTSCFYPILASPVEIVISHRRLGDWSAIWNWFFIFCLLFQLLGHVFQNFIPRYCRVNFKSLFTFFSVSTLIASEPTYLFTSLFINVYSKTCFR
jgi:hypothetical protein